VNQSGTQPRTGPITTVKNYRGKRVLDVLLTLASSPLWISIGIVCAALIRLDSSGPILFRQMRVGRAGSSFEVLKFRSMIHDQQSNPVIPDRRRITRVGRALRRLSLDELPQVLNVLRGEMSLVGPRPTLGYQIERYDDRQRQRLAVRPGLTGLAQLNGRNSISWAARIEWDLEYVKRQSPWLDLKLLILTPATVLTGRGLSGHPPDDPLVLRPPQ
jgi:lipopolysaccharide/colanic/teichoic acid biosynthesis glycosyltransferase